MRRYDAAVTHQLPDENSRWRCGHCGNLTRFDVERSRRVHEYWHFSMSGVPVVEDTTVVTEVVDKVTCRWCGASDRIEVVPRPSGDDAAAAAADAGSGPGGTP